MKVVIYFLIDSKLINFLFLIHAHRTRHNTAHAHNTTLCTQHTVPYHIMLHCTAPHHTALHHIILYRIIPHHIQHECERLKRSVSTIRNIVEQQTNWLTETESSLQKLFRNNVIERYNKECSSIDRLINMISECIEMAEPITNLWFLASDTIVVSKNILLTYPEPSEIIPNIEEKYDNKLNKNQIDMVDTWINSISLGNIVLEQDFSALLDRSLSTIGPYKTKSSLSENNFYNHLTFPKKWRENEKEIDTDRPREKDKEIEREKFLPTKIIPKIAINNNSNNNNNTNNNGDINHSNNNSSNNNINDNDKINQDMMRGIRKYLFSRDRVQGVDEHTGSLFVENISKVLKGCLSV